ncbi:MAG: hypothetical protein ABSD50_05350 [Smithella sp.]
MAVHNVIRRRRCREAKEMDILEIVPRTIRYAARFGNEPYDPPVLRA